MTTLGVARLEAAYGTETRYNTTGAAGLNENYRRFRTRTLQIPPGGRDYGLQNMAAELLFQGKSRSRLPPRGARESFDMSIDGP